jgi:hypothetical protein
LVHQLVDEAILALRRMAVVEFHKADDDTRMEALCRVTREPDLATRRAPNPSIYHPPSGAVAPDVMRSLS